MKYIYSHYEKITIEFEINWFFKLIGVQKEATELVKRSWEFERLVDAEEFAGHVSKFTTSGNCEIFGSMERIEKSNK